MCFHLYYRHVCISLYTCANVICIKLLLTYLLTYLGHRHGQSSPMFETSQREAFCDAWKAIKSVFGRVFASEPTGNLTTLPQTAYSRLRKETLPFRSLPIPDAFDATFLIIKFLNIGEGHRNTEQIHAKEISNVMTRSETNETVCHASSFQLNVRGSS